MLWLRLWRRHCQSAGVTAAVILALCGGMLAGWHTPAGAQAVVISADQTTTQDLDILAGADPGTSALVDPGVTVDTTDPPGSGGSAVVGSSRAWELTNGGFITGQNRGIEFDAGGEVINDPGSTIVGLTREGIRIRNATGTVENSGILTGGGDAIRLRNSCDVTNYSGATITGGADGIQIDMGGSVTNEANAVIIGINNVGIRIRTGMSMAEQKGTTSAV